MADEDELEITIVEDDAANVAEATKDDVSRQTATKDGTIAVEAKDPALKDLMAQYRELESKAQENERRAQEAEAARAAAQQEAARHRDDADVARRAQTSSHLDTITTAISASEQDVEGAKQAIRSAKTNGDIDAEIEAQDRLARAHATLLRLDEARQNIEARQKAPPPRQRPTDQVEAVASSLSPQSAAWVRAHPDYARTEQGLKKLNAADAVAKDEGFAPDTPEYFVRVEQYLGIRQAEAKAAPTEAADVKPTTAAKPRSAAPPVAPGASVSSNGASASGGSVTLTKGEYLSATDGTLVWNWDDPNGKYKKGDPIGVKEFARLKLKGMKEGRYDRTFTEN